MFAYAFLLYLISWLIFGWSGVLLLRTVGIEPLSAPLIVVSISVAAWLIGFCSLLTPGGLGIREAVFAGFLAQQMPTAKALACALLFRATWSFAEWGCVFLGGWLGLKERKCQE